MSGDDKKTYVQIWLALLALTIFEIAVTYLNMPRLGKVSLLLAMAATKMVLVAMFYMHLRYETLLLKTVVTVPIPVAILYTLALAYDLPFAWAQ